MGKTNVFANGEGITHKGSDGISTGGPDVCMTQVGNPIVPVPYPNIARSADLAGGSKSVKIQGQPGAIKGSCYSTSTGDEPGTHKGVGSGTVGDKAEFETSSFDVKIEGRGACRHSDMMSHNQKNTLGVNQQQSDSGEAQTPPTEPFDPNTIVIKVVEHLAYDAQLLDQKNQGGGIEVRFLPGNKDNTPVENVAVNLKLPDGSEVRKVTDEKGLIEIENLPIGEKCEATFVSDLAALNYTYLWFYETLTPIRALNHDQEKNSGTPFHWCKNDLMVGRSHLFSVYRPPVIIDSHMHIQSGHCAPMPMVWDKIPLLGKTRIRRGIIENLDKIIQSWVGKGTEAAARAMAAYYAQREHLGSDGQIYIIFLDPAARAAGDKAGKASADYYRKKTGVGMINKVQIKSTLDIAKKFISLEDPDETWPKVYRTYSEDKSYKGRRLLMPSVVMTMDMEYAHIDGYFGIKVYNGIYDPADTSMKNPLHYWFPLHRGNRAEHYKVGDQDAATPPLDAMSEAQFAVIKAAARADRPLDGTSSDDKQRSVTVEFEPCLANDEETVLYEPWIKQVKSTEISTLAYPLKFLPMFHYDPRRWQERGNSRAFEQVENKGLYLGFKMYTAQGYRPLDCRLPVLEDFYAKCAQKGIPIMNHCTPAGAYTFDRKAYIRFSHPNDTKADEQQKAKYRRHLASRGGNSYFYTDQDGKDYFNEFFVSPRAWAPVLEKHPDLRLCLAHFGGNSKEGRKWGDQLIEMMLQYDHLYADISSSFAEKKFRRRFLKKVSANPILEKRIIFGTDWYLTLMDKVKYPQFYKEARETLDSLDRSLWSQLTLANPCRFYRLADVVEILAGNFVAARQASAGKKGATLKKLKTKQVEEIMKDAAYIKEAYQIHDALEYAI